MLIIWPHVGTFKKNQASALSRSTSEYARLRLPVGLNPEREQRRVRFGEEAVDGDAATAKAAAREAAGAARETAGASSGAASAAASAAAGAGAASEDVVDCQL